VLLQVRTLSAQSLLISTFIGVTVLLSVLVAIAELRAVAVITPFVICRDF
jgi:hypothetical protein